MFKKCLGIVGKNFNGVVKNWIQKTDRKLLKKFNEYAEKSKKMKINERKKNLMIEKDKAVRKKFALKAIKSAKGY